MMKDDNITNETIASRLKFHSFAEMPFGNEQLPIFQTIDAPYEFYFQYQIEGNIHQLQSYRHLADLSTTVAPIAGLYIQKSENSFWARLWGQKSEQSQKISIYLKYYNHTLADWISLMKQKGALISQDQILSIFTTLLSLASAYHELYAQPAKIFNSSKIFLTPTRTLQIYPFQFQIPIRNFKTPQKTKRNQDLTIKKASTKCSHQTSLQSSQAMELYSYHSRQFSTKIEDDFQDIFLIIMEMLSFKKSDYFFSQKHQMIKWDLINQYLSFSECVIHLSSEFLQILKEIRRGKILNCEEGLQNLNFSEGTNRPKYLSLSISKELLQKKSKISQKAYFDQRKFLSKPFSFLKRK